jgi:hypothetical protein
MSYAPLDLADIMLPDRVAQETFASAERKVAIHRRIPIGMPAGSFWTVDRVLTLFDTLGLGANHAIKRLNGSRTAPMLKHRPVTTPQLHGGVADPCRITTVLLSPGSELVLTIVGSGVVTTVIDVRY